LSGGTPKALVCTRAALGGQRERQNKVMYDELWGEVNLI
jgi:hypothetical protein